jgi:hypothetical protein
MNVRVNLGTILLAGFLSMTGTAWAGDGCANGEFKQNNKCYKIGSQCSDYNSTSNKVCNNSKDTLQCDWDSSKSTCFAPKKKESGDCQPGEFKQDNVCYKLAAQCGEYSSTNDKVCNNSKDTLQCDWDNSKKICFNAPPKDGNKNPEPKMSLDDATNLLLSAPETQEMMVYKSSASFVGSPVKMPQGRFNKGKNQASFTFPPAPSEQNGLQRTMNLTAPVSLTNLTDPQHSSWVNTFTSKYASAELGFDYSVFTVKGANIVHQADAKAYADGAVLGYKKSLFDGRISGSYDAGPVASDRSDDYYSWRVRLDALGKTEYFKSGSGQLRIDLNETIAPFLPDRKVLFTTPTWKFVIAGLPMEAQVVPYGEYGMKDMKIAATQGYAATVSGKPFAGVVASVQVGPALRDLNRWAEDIGGIISSIQAYLGIDITVLRQTVNLYGIVGMRDPASLPLKAYMCRGANYDSLESLDGRIFAHAQVGIFTKVAVSVTKKVCSVFGDCLGFGDEVKEMVEKYTTLVYDHNFFKWDGKQWPQSKKPIDQGCSEYTI